MEVTPLEHAFLDIEAHRFGSLRADVTGAVWEGTAAADIRGARPLYSMPDDTLREIVDRARDRNMNFNKNNATRTLRDALRREISEREIAILMP